jgi:hypothetical protein
MNDAHYHLLLNHLPLIVPIVGLLVMLGGILLRAETVKRTALCIFVLGALCALPAMVTGDGAEHMVEDMEGVSHQMVHEHEETAEQFAFMAYGLGILSLVALWAGYKGKRFAGTLVYGAAALSVVVLAMGYQAGSTGGMIRHIEIRGE